MFIAGGHNHTQQSPPINLGDNNTQQSPPINIATHWESAYIMPRHSKGKGKGATSATNPKPPAAPKPKRSSRRLSQSPQSPIRNGKAKQTKKRALEPNTPSATQPKTVRKTAQLSASAQSVGNNDLISSPKATIKDIKVYGFSQHNKNAVCSVSLANCLVGDVCKVVQVTVRLTKGVNDALEKRQSPHLFIMQ